MHMSYYTYNVIIGKHLTLVLIKDTPLSVTYSVQLVSPSNFIFIILKNFKIASNRDMVIAVWSGNTVMPSMDEQR